MLAKQSFEDMRSQKNFGNEGKPSLTVAPVGGVISDSIWLGIGLISPSLSIWYFTK
jgi:hypothetical protein